MPTPYIMFADGALMSVGVARCWCGYPFFPTRLIKGVTAREQCNGSPVTSQFWWSICGAILRNVIDAFIHPISFVIVIFILIIVIVGITQLKIL
jgi:hypothetical protein